MSKRLDMPQHNGQCGHCSTQVPTEATVCTGCGARWGTSSGHSLQSLHDNADRVLRLGKFLLLTSLVAGFLAYSFDAIPAYLGVLLIALVSILVLMKGMEARWGANGAKVSWWRKD
jgi:hypothetical protein